MKRSVHVIYPSVIIVDVGVKRPKSVSIFLFLGFHIIGRAPVVICMIITWVCYLLMG
jgi:hypothetical protein